MHAIGREPPTRASTARRSDALSVLQMEHCVKENDDVRRCAMHSTSPLDWREFGEPRHV
jgi:hypothetical protein